MSFVLTHFGPKLRPEAQAQEHIALASMHEQNLRDQLAGAERALQRLRVKLGKTPWVDPADVKEPNPRASGVNTVDPNAKRNDLTAEERRLVDTLATLKGQLAEVERNWEQANAQRLVAEAEQRERAAFEASEQGRRLAEWKRGEELCE